MPSTTPNTGQVHASITEELKRMRLRTSSSSLRDLNDQPLLNFYSQERTFLHPEEGIVTAKESDSYIIAGWRPSKSRAKIPRWKKSVESQIAAS